MEDRLAIKRSDAWIWRSNLTRTDVLSRLEKRQISRDWLVCPQGSAGRAVTVGQFVDDPAIFQRQDQEAANEERRRRAIVASVERPPLLKIGQKLLQLFFACLVVGGAIVRISFPHMLGAGLTPSALMILVPIWSIGGIGVVAWVLGGLHYRHQVHSALRRELDVTSRST
ncbi:MAG: hypothetical protein KY476_21345 [Planctomycetes bacterium]|nr:hypothetical protein [Planctomycetota bacterium]